MFRRQLSERRREQERNRSSWWKRTLGCFSPGHARDAAREQRRANEAHVRIAVLLSRPRISPQNRVDTAVELVNELRRMHETAGAAAAGNGSSANNTSRHSQTAALFIALSMRELDELIDSMSYEELWEAFGGRDQRRGLSGEVIAALPSHQVSAAEAPRLGACSVCQDSFHSHQTLRCLPACSHAFHAECIDGWLEKKADCPVCRRKVVPPSPAAAAASSLPVEE